MGILSCSLIAAQTLLKVLNIFFLVGLEDLTEFGGTSQFHIEYSLQVLLLVCISSVIESFADIHGILNGEAGPLVTLKHRLRGHLHFTSIKVFIANIKQASVTISQLKGELL